MSSYWDERETLIQSRLEELGYLFEIKEIDGEKRALNIFSHGKKQKPLPDSACFELTPYEYMSALLRGMTEAFADDALYELKSLTENDLKPLSVAASLRIERAHNSLKEVTVNNSIMMGRDPRKARKES